MKRWVGELQILFPRVLIISRDLWIKTKHKHLILWAILFQYSSKYFCWTDSQSCVQISFGYISKGFKKEQTSYYLIVFQLWSLFKTVLKADLFMVKRTTYSVSTQQHDSRKHENRILYSNTKYLLARHGSYVFFLQKQNQINQENRGVKPIPVHCRCPNICCPGSAMLSHASSLSESIYPSVAGGCWKALGNDSCEHSKQVSSPCERRAPFQLSYPTVQVKSLASLAV